MWLRFKLLPLVLCTLAVCDARRIRVRPEPVQEDTIQYYAAEEPQDGSDQQQQQIVIVSADQYNGYYGRPAASRSSSANENYIASTRSSSAAAKAGVSSARTKEPTKAPPVQTIRNYNKVNDDGSFTFGYEAADGSFKEETRGTDCVVRGKYGYIDPDGNKREFTYVSGNPCDPNAPQDDEEEVIRGKPQDDSNEADSGPANYPTKPIRPLRPTVQRQPVTVFQNTYDQEEDDEQPEPEQVLRQHPVQPTRARLIPVRPTYVQDDQPSVVTARPRLQHSTTASPVVYQTATASPINITPRPITATPAPTRSSLPATTYRPQLLQVAVTPRPSSLLYTKQSVTKQQPNYVSSTPSSGSIDFAAEFARFQQENNLVSPTPRTAQKPAKSAALATRRPDQPVYTSELVYDPASGQYNTQLYQTLPQTDGEFTLNHRIQPYVHQSQPQPQLYSLQQLQQQSPIYRQQQQQQQPQPQQSRVNGQALYQQQQAELQLHNSQQLYAQQQRARTQNAQQQPATQSFYYIQPSALNGQQGSLAGGQIEAFLRGHNIQF